MTRLADTVEALAALVAFPTVSADSNLVLIDWLADRLAMAGARVEVLRDATGTKANLWATLGPEGDGGLVLSGHTDVVPVTDQDWTSDPFTLRDDAGRLFGRGTCDMKGFIAACVAMAPDFAALPLRRPLHFAFTHDEEVGCLGARALVPALQARGIRPALAIIGEPTSMQVIEGHKGCCEYTIRFQGRAGHGSAPGLGVNAAEFAARYAARLLALREDLIARTPEDSRFDPPWTTLNIGRIAGGAAHNVIAPKAEIDWEMRPVADSDADFVNGVMDDYVHRTLLPAMQAIAPEAAIDRDVIGEVAGLEPRTRNAARDLVMRLTGAHGAGLVPFGTEAGLFQAMGVDVVVCGPGSIDQAHKADEYVTTDQLAACLQLLRGLGDWLTTPPEKSPA